MHVYPAGHVTHAGKAAPGPALCVRVELENEPDGQLMGADTPAGQYAPSGHIVHSAADASAVDADHEPAGQGNAFAALVLVGQKNPAPHAPETAVAPPEQ